jgi:signal transduction histidine kinase
MMNRAARSATGEQPMTLQHLKWLAIIAPLGFLALLEVARQALIAASVPPWLRYLLLGGIILLAVLAFSELVFAVIRRLHTRLAAQNRELLALHHAELDIASDLDLDVVLQRVVVRATRLVGARYGALWLLAGAGRGEADRFISVGLPDDLPCGGGPPPAGHGLLGIALREGRPMRLDDLTRDPRSVGFPPGHPAMRSLLAVPIVARGAVLGNLYLADKGGGETFAADDEAALTRFATQAALAIENARLHRAAQDAAIGAERLRIAREMHDGLAQVLGYVNTKAQATQELLRQGQLERASQQLGQFAEAARAAYDDVREQILGLRTTLGDGQGLAAAIEDYLARWQEQSGVQAAFALDASEEALRALPPSTEVQLLRIVQEALSNTRKHAAASRATVSISAEAAALVVRVADDGSGFDLTAPGASAYSGVGLASMRERAVTIGGAFAVETAPGRGTTIVVRVPLQSGRAAMSALDAAVTVTVGD